MSEVWGGEDAAVEEEDGYLAEADDGEVEYAVNVDVLLYISQHIS